MRSLLIVFAVVGVAVGKPAHLGLGLGGLVHAPAAYSSVVSPVAYSTVAAAPAASIAYAAPAVTSSQYHAQDELGQYSYGYAGGPSAKSEVKTWDGVTRGGYSYVDAEGKVQSVNYVADPVHGFRVAATNLPVAPVAPEPLPVEPLVAPVPVEDTAEVAAAKEAHFTAVAEAKAAAEAAPEELVVVETPAAPAAVAVAAADVLPASVLSRDVGAVALTPAPVAYQATVAPFSNIAYSAIAPAVAPISYSATAPALFSAVAPISYSAIAPALAPAVAPISYSAIAPALTPAVAPISYSAIAPALTPAVAPISYSSISSAVSHAPLAVAAPVEVSSQYHAQDELGQYSYGYAGGPSAKSEVKTFDGVTRGGYSYVDAEGKVQSVNYVADPIHGFRVAATNLPVAPSAPATPVLATVLDTVEVAAAKAEHLVAVEEAKARLASA